MDPLFIVQQCYEKLPANMRAEPWKATGHGKNELQNEDQLNAYIAAYGEMHIIKCRAALQNFPFEELQNNSFEIIDWGCGQGIATLTLLDMLFDRKLSANLRKITLLEPSKVALDRAVEWVRRFAGSNVNIEMVNKAIPQDETDVFEEITCSSNILVNLFSNILDIRSLSLSWLAKKTASLANINYMICVGPKFPSNVNTRILDFCGYFQPKSYFSEISSYPYAYTSSTHHPFGCETRCFVHYRQEMLCESYIEIADAVDATDPYSNAAECLRGIVSDNVLLFYDQLLKNCNSNSSNVFFRPSINCDKVDFVWTNVDRGIALINVCECIDDLEKELSRIKGIRDNLFAMHLKSIKIDSITRKNVFYYIHTALFFPNTTRDEVTMAANAINAIKGGDCLKDMILFFPSSNITAELNAIHSKKCKNEYQSELISLIVGKWHSYKDGDADIKLTRRQTELVRSTQTRLKVKGVAGSGKTLVIAYRAVEQYLRTGKRVLIITFNITLMQYIRMKINQVRADFPTNMFEITNYHQFFHSMMVRYTGQNFGDADDPEFFQKYANDIQKYQSIIIDEVQDFKSEWLRSIFTYFIEPKGSISVFGDGEQNIYDIPQEIDTHMPPIPTIRGGWNELNERMSERISIRLQNPNIAALASQFAKEYIPDFQRPIAPPQNILFEDYVVKYWDMKDTAKADEISGNIHFIIERFRLKPKDVTILGQSHRLLRDVEDSYAKKFQERSMINSETKAQYDSILKESKYPNKDIEDIRRVAKTHFTTDCDMVKFSTIHSFKGWESKSIILIILPQVSASVKPVGYCTQKQYNMNSLLYTAITRARCNLFVINIANEKYGDFFKKHIR